VLKEQLPKWLKEFEQSTKGLSVDVEKQTGMEENQKEG